jgi:ribosomal-protein-alanine N-acetyltransferase
MIWWPPEIPTLTHGLITLRQSVESDIEAIYQACQDPLISTFTTVPSHYTKDLAVEFVRQDPFSFRERREFRFVVEYGNGDERKFAGVISLHTINIKNHTAELGYWIEKSMRGKGIGTTATRMITNYGFVTMGFRRIDAHADVDNVASQKLLMSAGLDREGILRNKVTREDGSQIDMALFAATNISWKPLNP